MKCVIISSILYNHILFIGSVSEKSPCQPQPPDDTCKTSSDLPQLLEDSSPSIGISDHSEGEQCVDGTSTAICGPANEAVN